MTDTVASDRPRGGHLRRVYAMLIKELLQLKRDRVTLATMRISNMGVS